MTKPYFHILLHYREYKGYVPEARETKSLCNSPIVPYYAYKLIGGFARRHTDLEQMSVDWSNAWPHERYYACKMCVERGALIQLKDTEL